MADSKQKALFIKVSEIKRGQMIVLNDGIPRKVVSSTLGKGSIKSPKKYMARFEMSQDVKSPGIILFGEKLVQIV
jgi:hypothetical protein